MILYEEIARVWLGVLTQTTLRFEGIDGSHTYVQFRSNDLAQQAFAAVAATGRARGTFVRQS